MICSLSITPACAAHLGNVLRDLGLRVTPCLLRPIRGLLLLALPAPLHAVHVCELLIDAEADRRRNAVLLLDGRQLCDAIGSRGGQLSW
eukprot:1143536-Pelagomonas_calceolata.AAC.3